MRFIAFSDIHMSTNMCSNIKEIEYADMLIATGDLTNYGNQADARKVLDQLLSYNSNLLAVFGNLDNFEINDYLEQLSMNLHGQAKFIKGKVCVFGVGGSNITPFGTPGEFTEKQLEEILHSGHEQAKEFITLGTSMNSRTVPTILVSHAPPYGTNVDKLRSGKHVGSKAVRSFIEKCQPDLCLTGHIHEARGEDRIGKTHIINPGMLQQGGWVDIQLIQTTLHATLQ